MNEIVRCSKEKIDGTRLVGCTDKELKQLLKMRCEELANGENHLIEYTHSSCMPVVEVLNAIILNSQMKSSFDEANPPLFLSPLYEESE